MENFEIKKRRRWWLAGFLSFMLPGLGQVYNGQETKGLLYYVALSVWGGIFMSLFYYLKKPPLTSGHIALICILALVSVIFWLYILFEAIRSAKRISNDYVLKKYNRWYIYIIVIVIIHLVDFSTETVIVKNTIFKAFKAPAGSMMPTIFVGDHFICDLSYYRTHNPARGDIVVFKWPVDESIFYIKRIIGIPGDTIQIINDELYVNNIKLELKFIKKYRLGEGKEADICQETIGDSSYQILEQIKKYENFRPVTVPAGEYFVMGDNRDNSNDSRYWGMVKRHQIYGRPAFIYFSWDMKIPAWNIFGRLASIRFSRIGDVLE
jgi:signal peptidase I